MGLQGEKLLFEPKQSRWMLESGRLEGSSPWGESIGSPCSQTSPSLTGPVEENLTQSESPGDPSGYDPESPIQIILHYIPLEGGHCSEAELSSAATASELEVLPLAWHLKSPGTWTEW